MVKLKIDAKDAWEKYFVKIICHNLPGYCFLRLLLLKIMILFVIFKVYGKACVYLIINRVRVIFIETDHAWRTTWIILSRYAFLLIIGIKLIYPFSCYYAGKVEQIYAHDRGNDYYCKTLPSIFVSWLVRTELNAYRHFCIICAVVCKNVLWISPRVVYLTQWNTYCFYHTTNKSGLSLVV